MLPHKHVIISAAVGGIAWAQTGDPVSCAMALAAGILPDVDHAVDYLYLYRGGEHRLVMPMHGYEYALLASGVAWVTGSKLLAVAALSYLIHLLADQVENRTRPLGYSLLYRAVHRFRIEGISTMPEAAIRGREDDLRRLRSLLSR